MATPDLTTTKGLQTYLELQNHQPATIRLLTGGTANYVYRAIFEDEATVIYKHAAPYLHSNKGFAFDPLRMDYEDKILEMLSLEDNKDSFKALARLSVHAVRVLSYDKENKLLCMEDGGQKHLKDAYSNHELDILKIGEDLGRWSATFHTTSRQASLGLAHDNNTNNDIAVRIYRHSYQNLSAALSIRGHDPKLGERINDEFGSLLATDDECVCHGDFWPGNVLIHASSSSTERPVKMTIVDWEMVRRGTSATDVGQFAAESFLLDRFRGGKGLLAAFLRAYAMTREGEGGVKLGKAWLKRVAVHWAVHVAFWPTCVEWTDQSGTDELVCIGVEVMTAALEDDWKKLKDSLLFREVKDTWGFILERA